MGIFGAFLVTGGHDQSNYLNSGNFLGHFRVTSRLPEINCRKKTFAKSLGGAMAPLAPPWLRHCFVSGSTPLRSDGHHNGVSRDMFLEQTYNADAKANS